MNVPSLKRLLQERGDSQYGGEAVTQLEHALQAALLAEQCDASSALIAAALLHDIGHLLHRLPDDAPETGVDDRHETSGANFLAAHFVESVVAPVRLHVPAKRYLCAVDANYERSLSEPSRISLRLQGGPMSSAEVEAFEQEPFASDATLLRKWDDEAKIPDLSTPSLDHFWSHVAASTREAT